MVVHCLRFRSKQRGVVKTLEKQEAELLVLQMALRQTFVQLWIIVEKSET